MFTGLIQDMGRVESLEENAEGLLLRVGTRLGGELEPGDSIAVDGACLTAVEPAPESFTAEVMRQTLDFTTIGELEPGASVNLEPAAKLGDRLGGHLVQGHVDGVATVDSRRDDGFARRLRVTIPAPLAAYVVAQGSVTLNGVSLTVAGNSEQHIGAPWFEVSLIPETLERTNLGDAEPGSRLNFESDLIAKYVERLLEARPSIAEHRGSTEEWKPVQ